MGNALRALWLCSALVPGFAALMLYQAARVRILFHAASDAAEFPPALNRIGLLMQGAEVWHLFGAALIFAPVMAVVLAVGRAQRWLAGVGALFWMALVLGHLALKIPATPDKTPAGQEPLMLYLLPAIVMAMLLFRLLTRRRRG